MLKKTFFVLAALTILASGVFFFVNADKTEARGMDTTKTETLTMCIEYAGCPASGAAEECCVKHASYNIYY